MTKTNDKKAGKTSYEMISTEILVPYARNARTHSESQISQIMGSIREFGFLNPIIIDDSNNVLAGHGRLLAAQRLGLKEVPVIRESHLTPIQRKAYILADNKIAENSDWDESMLNIELAALKADNFDFEVMGFNEGDFCEEADIELPVADKEEEKEEEKARHFNIVIQCNTEEEQQALFNKLSEDGINCKCITI